MDAPQEKGELTGEQRARVRQMLNESQSSLEQLKEDYLPRWAKTELARLREEEASMRTAIKEGHAALEKALFVHKAITTYAKQSSEDLAANMEHCGILAEALATLSPFTESK